MTEGLNLNKKEMNLSNKLKIIKSVFDLKRLFIVSRLRQSFSGHNLGNEPPTNPVKIRSVFLFL